MQSAKRTLARKAAGVNMKTTLVALTLFLMVVIAVAAALPLDFGAKRRRRKTLEKLSHAKHYLWDRSWAHGGDDAALKIIQEKLVEVYGE